MADINPHHTGTPRTESDGINYRGIIVFVAILAVTTLVCELIVVGMFKMFDARQATSGAARAPLSAPAGTMPPPPNLVVNEPATLTRFLAGEEQVLTSYAWQDRSTGVVRLPIARAKDLLLERGLPVRGAEAPTPGARPEIKK